MSGSTINLTALKFTFDDEFNTFVSSHTGTLGWETHYPFSSPQAYNLAATDEIQFYGDSTIGINPFTNQNGILDITATVAPAGSNYLNEPYNSGAINSFQSVSQLYGYFEVRAEVPNLPGLWGAFWMIPTNGSGSSELDGFEIVGSYPGYVFETTHNTVSGVDTQNLQWYQGINPATGFHTYGVDWEPNTITWYIDGVAVNTAPTPSNMHTPMAMIINLAVGGPTSWPGAPTSASEFPSTMQIDYVRAYATANTVDIAGTQAIKTGTGTGSIFGQVLYSYDGGTATAVSGYDVTLVNSSGNVVANAITSSSGNYTFTGLVAGSYQIQYVPPAGEVVGPGGPASTATNLTPVIVLATGQAYSAATETLITAPATIEGQVLFATSSVGMALAGIVVQLLNTSGGVLASATTDVNGKYVFTGLYAGSYAVAFTVPAGESLAAGGPVSPGTSQTGVLTVVAGQVLNLAPATIIPPGASLSGQVLESTAGTSATGLGAVAVDLLNAQGAVVLTTTTNGSGIFLFTGLAPGSYSVQYLLPKGVTPEIGGVANPVTGLSAPVTLTSGQALSLAAEQLLTSPATITGGVYYAGGAQWQQPGMTVLLLSSTGSTLASTVTTPGGIYTFSGVAAGTYELQYVLPTDSQFYSGYENFGTGITASFTAAPGQTVGESPVGITHVLNAYIVGTVLYQPSGGKAAGQSGVTVSLYDGSGDLLTSTTSNSSGSYQFLYILPGVYEVGFTSPSGDSLLAGGPANTATGFTNLITLGETQTFTVANETLVPATSTAILAGSVTYGGAVLAGETVTLINSGGTLVATETSAANGSFAFGGLVPGAYQIDYLKTAAQAFSSGPANAATGLTPLETLSAGQTLTLAAEALVAAPAAITGAVTYAGAPLSGETITLLNAAGNTIGTTTTGGSGTFQFLSLAAGAYEVEYSITGAQTFGTGPANSPSGVTALLQLGAGQTLALATEPLLASQAAAAISGIVTYAGAADVGVGVTLFTTTGTQVATTTTNGNGQFAFSGLAAGSYEVQYSLTAAEVVASGPALSGLTAPLTLTAGQNLVLATEALVAAPSAITGVVTLGGTLLSGETVALLNAGGTTLATTTTGTQGTFQFSALAAGSYEILYSHTGSQTFGSGPANTTTGLTPLEVVTAGQTLALATETLVQQSTVGTITGSVQRSASGTGAAALPGVTVALISVGKTLSTSLTDSNGNFSFTGLAAGTYTVQYTAPSGAVLEFGSTANTLTGQSGPITLALGQTYALPTEQLLTNPASLSASEVFAGTGVWPEAGTTVALLNASGSQLGTGVTNSAGTVTFSGLAAGSYELDYIMPTGAVIQSGPSNLTLSTGITSPISVAAGAAASEAVVKLAAASPATIAGHTYFTNASGGTAAQAGDSVSLISATGATLATDISNGWGGFSFYDLLQGSYQLLYTAPSGEVLGTGPANAATGLTSVITLTPGQTVNLANETLVPNANAQPASLGGTVTYAGAPLAGEAISLLNSSGGTVATTTTGSTGAFQFSGLAAGSYQVLYSETATQIFGSGPANTATGLTSLLTLVAGQTLTLGAEALLPAPTATLSGVVQTSLNGSSPIAQASVSVALVNAAGATLTSTLSDSSGNFQFSSLAAGIYELDYTAPTGQVLEFGSLANPATGLTPAITLAQGQTLAVPTELMLSRPNSLNGFVEHYGEGDPGSGQSGVAVSLLTSGGTTLATTITDGNGDFSFADLPGGSYEIYYAAPAGEYIRSGYGADPTTGLSPVIALGANTNSNINKVVLQSNSNTFSLTGTAATAIRGAGNYVVTGNASGSTLTLGAGNQSVSLTGGGDTIVVGAGNSTISALGAGNSITAGAGMNFITLDGSAGNVVYLNGSGQGTDTITGFNTVGDLLDLKSTLSGVSIAQNFSNLGTYVTASVAGGTTTLSVDPTGGHGTPSAFAILNNVSTSVAQLIAANDITLA